MFTNIFSNCPLIHSLYTSDVIMFLPKALPFDILVMGAIIFLSVGGFYSVVLGLVCGRLLSIDGP